MTPKQLNALCELLMSSDPSPVSAETLDLVKKVADDEAVRQGHDNWIHALHMFTGEDISNDPWDDNTLQFCRLIAEGEANDLFCGKALVDTAADMDIEIEQIMELIERAQSAWDNTKAILL